MYTRLWDEYQQNVAKLNQFENIPRRMREREREKKKCNLNRIFACEHGRLLCYIREMRQHISCPALGRRKKKKKKQQKIKRRRG
jgi:hypothetical protein